MAPLTPFDYFVSILFGIGGMFWFTIACSLKDRYEELQAKKQEKQMTERFIQDDDNNYDSIV